MACHVVWDNLRNRATILVSGRVVCMSLKTWNLRNGEYIAMTTQSRQGMWCFAHVVALRQCFLVTWPTGPKVTRDWGVLVLGLR